MSTDDELTPREHNEMRDLLVAGTQRIRPAGSHRAQFVAAGVALILVGAVTGGIFTAALRDDSAPNPVASADSQQTGTIPNGGTPPPSTPSDLDPQAWIRDLPAGRPPLVPYFHDGVLHVSGAEIETPFDVGPIVVAGRTVLVGGEPNTGGTPTTWWLVEGDRLEQIPASDEYYPALSADGRIAYWQTSRGIAGTTFVMWDTETNRELATHTVSGRFTTGHRLQMIGVDAAGIAYWVDQSSDTPIMRWDVRADIVEPTDLPFDSSKTFNDQAAPIPDVFIGQEDSYVSPDGAKEIFTDRVPSDSPEDCCETQVRVRPVGPLETVDPGDITTLQLPEGIPGMRLWDAYSDRGASAWWETNETVLLVAVVEAHGYLVRCWATGGACELVFDLGPSSEELYPAAEWEQEWAFADFPVAQ